MDTNVSRRRLLGIVAAGTAATAGCAGGSSTTDGERMPTDTDTPTATPTDGSAAMVQVSSHPDLGDVLVGPEGMTLYMFDQDTQGSSTSSCYDGCADNWPPLTVDGSPSAGDDVTAELSTFEREDGTMQVTANGWPLYYFTPDEEPGDANGQGANDVWWVLGPDGSPIRSSESPTETETEAGNGTATPTETDSRY